MPQEIVNSESKNAPHCSSCFSPTDNLDFFCPVCGYPLKATEEVQNEFLRERSFKQAQLNELNKKVKNAGNTLYVLAVIFFGFGLITFFMNRESDQSTGLLIVNGIVGLIFIGLGYGSQKKPLVAIISGMVLFGLIQLLAIFEDPSTIFKGLLFKIIIIGYLIKGLNSALAAEKIKTEHSI